MSATLQRAQAISERLPEGRVYGAEVGVWNGALSQLLLLNDNLTLIMVDSWAPKAVRATSYVGSGDPKATCSDKQMEAARLQAIACTGFAQHRAQILHMDSALAATTVPDHVLDFVFIDADHSFDGVCRDIHAWLPKVKPGGWIGGHDYGDDTYAGVQRAVDTFFSVVETGPDKTWFVRC